MDQQLQNLNALLGNQDNSNSEILMALLTPENIYMKTKITNKQARSMFKLKYMLELQKAENQDKTGIEILMITLDWYLAVIVSINGERTSGILGTMKEMRPQFEDKPIIDTLKK